MGPGQPLPEGDRAFFEARLGADLTDVQVHSGEASHRAAGSLGASAFTVGSHVGFRAGLFAPGTPEGRRLLAHELTHVLQGRGGAQTRPEVNRPGDASEREADRVADQLMATELPHAIRVRPGPDAGVVQRQAVHDLTRETALPESVETLSDEELQSQSLRLRERLSQLPPGDAEYATIRQNLHLVESVAARVSVDLPAPTAGTDHSFEFKGRVLTPDPVSTRYLLERVIFEQGQGAAEDFVDDAESALDESDVDTPDTKQMYRDYRLALIPVLRAQFGILKKENAEFVEEFERAAKETLRDLLNQSEQRIEDERVRYGIPAIARILISGRPDTTLYEYGALPTPAVKELQVAAGLILRLRARRDARLEALKKEVRQLTWLSYEEGVTGSEPEGGPAEAILRSDQVAKDRRDIELEGRLYGVQKAELARRYPVLASFFEDDDEETGKLEELSSGDWLQAMSVALGEIAEKQYNIAVVREKLDRDDIDVWELPRLIATTRLGMHVAVLTMRDRILRDKVEDVADAGFWKSIGLGILQLGLVLLAPLTEGLTLIPAAAISGKMLVSHVEEYTQQKALAGTDFDKARAISASEPSRFWLALDVVFFIADVGAALGAFRNLSKLVPEVRAARTAEEAEQIVRAAVPEGGEGFARRVAADARVGEEVSAEERIFGAEGRTIEEAGMLAGREAAEAVIAEIRTASGQTIKVTKGGHLVICSSPCQWLRERFVRQIAGNEELEARIAALESKAAAAAAEGDVAITRRLGDEIATEVGVLERDLAYAEYLEGGGRATLEEFAAAERVRGIVLSTAHATPTLIPAARIADVTSRLIGRFPVLGRLTQGAVERVVRAGHALAETGGLRRAKSWVGAARGQLLEELASARVRGLLSTQAGREALGLGHLTDELVFIEGSRIRDAAGAMLTDGVIAIRRADQLEIVAVMEAKAGSFAAGGLTESVAGLRRASTSDITQAVIEASGGRSGRGVVSQRAMMKRLEKLLSPDQYRLLETGGANLAESGPALAKLRESLLSAIEGLPARDRRAIRDALSRGEGQVPRDLERLMKEGNGTVPLMIDDLPVTATVPTRPSFVGAAPTDVPLTDIAKELRTQGYDLRALDLGEEAMTTQELDSLAAELVDQLGSDLINAATP